MMHTSFFSSKAGALMSEPFTWFFRALLMSEGRQPASTKFLTA